MGDEERRVVTVLFADLVGFTSLAEERDPEQVKRLVDAAFELLVADVEAHGGMVDKVLGDGIVALFGAPVAHEDDAERAVRAGLTMQATLREFRDEHPADDLQMRIGINTGEVLVGTVAGSDYTAMGDVVNTASRLQGIAEPDTVIVGAATKELCSAMVRFQPIDPVRLRGRVQLTEAWRATGIDSAGVVRRWSSDVRFVGRRSEVGMLDAVVSTVTAGRAAIVAVSGEAGIGKSRLIGETVNRLLAEHPNALLLEGICAPYGESNVWWPVVGSLLGRFGLSRDTTAEEARRRGLQRLTIVPELAADPVLLDRMTEVLVHVLGHPSRVDALDALGTRDLVVGAITTFLRHRATEGPVVLWIDDLQWAPALLRELLESLGRQLAGLPVLIAATYRTPDEGALEWPPPVDPALTLHLTLEPLAPAEASELVAAAGAGLDAAQAASIANRAGGNPLYLIELARLATGSSATAAADLPGSLRALIAARLDSLSPTQREIIDNAAVVGQEGRMSSLRVFADAIGQRYDPAEFAVLVEAGLLVRSGSRWRFRSDVVREVAYQTLTKQTRCLRHAGIARHLAEFEPSAIDGRAHHLATAAELRLELGSVPDVPAEISESAVELLAMSAERWQHQGANRRSLGLIERALNLHASDDHRWREMALVRVSLLVDLRELRRARQLANELIERAEAAGDRVTSAEATRLIGTIEQNEGDLVAARQRLGSAVAVFRDLGDERRLAEALRARGFAEVFGGSLAEADRYLDEAAVLFDRVGGERGSAWVEQHRAWVSFLSGDHAASALRLATAVAAFDRLGDRAGRSWSLGLMAYVHHFNHRDDEAMDLAAEVLDDAKRWGDDWGASMMRNLQASVMLWRGEVDEARTRAERALAGFRRIDDRFGMIQALGTLNRAYVALGRFADADRSIEETLVMSGAFGELAYPAISAAGTAMHMGDGRRAAKYADEAVGRLDTTGANVEEGRVVYAFGLLLSGDADAALARLVEVDVGSSPFALSARATALALIGERAGALADVEAVEAMPSVSYWDLAVAQTAGAAAAQGVERERRVANLAELADRLDDAVLHTYVSLVVAGLTGESADSVSGPLPINGWADVARGLIR